MNHQPLDGREGGTHSGCDSESDMFYLMAIALRPQQSQDYKVSLDSMGDLQTGLGITPQEINIVGYEPNAVCFNAVASDGLGPGAGGSPVQSRL